MGFSLHDTLIYKGTKTEIHYQNHLEAVYCIEGNGRILDLTNNQEHVIEAGTMYALNGNEKHLLIAEEQMRMIWRLQSAHRRPRTHDENGVYPLMT